MPTARQVEWVEAHRKICEPSYADIGCRVAERTDSKTVHHSLRHVIHQPHEKWLGIDMQPGREVDIVRDLTDPIPEAWKGSFKTIFAMSVLEHVRDIFTFARNVSAMLAPGGHLFVSVPWCWRYHAHPRDYCRMSPEAVEYLFQTLTPIKKRCCIQIGHKQKNLPRFDIRLSRPYKNREKHLMKPVTVNMVFRNDA